MKTSSNKTIIPWKEMNNYEFRPDDVKKGEMSIQFFITATYMPKVHSTKMAVMTNFKIWDQPIATQAIAGEDLFLMHNAMVSVIARKFKTITGIEEKDFLKHILNTLDKELLTRTEKQ